MPGLRAFFHTGHQRSGAVARNAKPQAACPCTEVIHHRPFPALQKREGALADDLTVSPGAQHTRPDLERKVHKVPLAQNVLQRLAGSAAFGKRAQAGCLGRAGAVIQTGVAAGRKAVQLGRVKAGIRHTGGRQHGAELLKCSVHQRASSCFSGRTGVTAAIATSIIESSGSKVVSRCIQSPG